METVRAGATRAQAARRASPPTEADEHPLCQRSRSRAGAAHHDPMSTHAVRHTRLDIRFVAALALAGASPPTEADEHPLCQRSRSRAGAEHHDPMSTHAVRHTRLDIRFVAALALAGASPATEADEHPRCQRTAAHVLAPSITIRCEPTRSRARDR
jgi:hypothetical protein